MMTFNDGGVIAYMNGMLARMANMAPAMAEIGANQVHSIQERIIEGKADPDGIAWAPWRPFTRDQREGKGNAAQGLLWDTGALLHSIIAQPGANGVVIGTSVPYAHDLQEGVGMTRRPFIGWSEEGKQVAEHFAVRYIEGLPA